MKKVSIICWNGCFYDVVSHLVVVKTEEAAAPAEEIAAKTEAAVPEYKLMNDLPTVDVYFPERCRWQVTLFDGKSFNGWRGYGRTDVPAAWDYRDG